MITKIKIQNFKSIDQLEIELGRINVLIGANGSGKSNLLEGIAMGAAGIADKLEHEFLSTRIRVTPPKFMTSAFETDEKKNTIEVAFTANNSNGKKLNSATLLEYANKKWTLKDLSFEIANNQINLNKVTTQIFKINDLTTKSIVDLLNLEAQAKLTLAEIDEIFRHISAKHLLSFSDEISKAKKYILEQEEDLKKQIREQRKIFEVVIDDLHKQTNIKNFLIFAPENHFLRNFNEESQLRPIGLRGEGLFNHIVELHREKPALLAQINEALRVLDWFDGFEMPNDLMFTEKRIRIKDNYLQPDLSYFDQRSANEGFLYLLFYFTLFISDETPSFFAIDNIDNAMNPKLGRHLVKTLAELAKKHQKQALLTTHNPAILDGLNLDDDEQRLFVIYRNADGQTKARRIFKKKTDKNISLPLSEMFLRGYLGGLPNNF